MRVLAAFVSTLIYLSPALSDTVDVFPLERGIVYEYLLFAQSTAYELLYFIGSSTDSGFVRCIVTDSIRLNDTTISWNVQQQRGLYHRCVGLMPPYWRDTTFSATDTISFSLLEYSTGRHLMITPTYNQTWNFFQYDSLYRFADSPGVLMRRQWYSPPPLGSSGTDSIWLSDTSGFSRRRRSATQWAGNHSWMNSRLEITLLHNPTVDVRQWPIEQTPMRFILEQNYPNPFNPTTTIAYSLPRTSHVVLSVCDILGRTVRTLVNGMQQPGRHLVSLDASPLSTGTYFLRLEAEGAIQTRKMNIVK